MGKVKRAANRATRKLVQQVLKLGQWALEKTAQEAGISTREMPWDAPKFGACMLKVQANRPRKSDSHSYNKEDARKICAAEMWYSIGVGPHMDFDHTFPKRRREIKL